jgi:transcriptional regulator with XRE-family HTH domain
MTGIKVAPPGQKWTPMSPTLLFMTDEKRRPRPAAQYGPTAETVAQNVRRFRERRGMTIYSLSGALGEAGRPITPSAIAKIEKQQRQVTVDDLTALAKVLEVSPSALLLPPADTGPVNVTPATAVPWKAAWRWAHGEEPPFSREGVDADYDERRRRFLAECQPYRDRDHLAELAKYIRARVDGPWHVEIDSNGETEHGTLSLRSERTRYDERESTLEDLVHVVAEREGIDLTQARIRVYSGIAKQQTRGEGADG